MRKAIKGGAQHAPHYAAARNRLIPQRPGAPCTRSFSEGISCRTPTPRTSLAASCRTYRASAGCERGVAFARKTLNVGKDRLAKVGETRDTSEASGGREKGAGKARSKTHHSREVHPVQGGVAGQHTACGDVSHTRSKGKFNGEVQRGKGVASFREFTVPVRKRKEQSRRRIVQE